MPACSPGNSHGLWYWRSRYQRIWKKLPNQSTKFQHQDCTHHAVHRSPSLRHKPDIQVHKMSLSCTGLLAQLAERRAWYPQGSGFEHDLFLKAYNMPFTCCWAALVVWKEAKNSLSCYLVALRCYILTFPSYSSYVIPIRWWLPLPFKFHLCIMMFQVFIFSCMSTLNLKDPARCIFHNSVSWWVWRMRWTTLQGWGISPDQCGKEDKKSFLYKELRISKKE